MDACRPGTALFALAVLAGSVGLALVGLARTPLPDDPRDGAGALIGPRVRAWYRGRIAPAEIALAHAGVTPDGLTYTQFVVSLLAGGAFWTGCVFLGGVLVILAGTLDILDGGLARRIGAVSPRGAFVDSVVDRWAEIVTFVGLGAYFLDRWVVLVVVVAAFCSQMVSYVRARAEALGVTMTVGSVQRPERYVLLGFGAGLSSLASHLTCAALGHRQDVVLVAALVVLAAVSAWTAVERSRFAYRALRAREDA